MNNFIYTNSNHILNKINYMINNGIKRKKKNHCPVCNEVFDCEFMFNCKKKDIKIQKNILHLLKIHNLIDSTFYKKISKLKIPSDNIDYCLLSTNGLNIIDGLYEIGSERIYGDINKTVKESKNLRNSEHFGFIYFKDNRIDKITVLNNYRVDKADPLIYMPAETLESLKVNYLFHTHPTTPYIGSRIKDGIIYEFPSISDIIHFIEHHNNGKLIGSLVFAPEGTYIIKKNTFNRKKIKVDYDILIDNLEDIMIECYTDSINKYSYLDYNSLKINNQIKIPDNKFYELVANNYEYINKINDLLIKYDLFIEYYARILLNDPVLNIYKWIIPDIYIPNI